jgi:hypothetical protein
MPHTKRECRPGGGGTSNDLGKLNAPPFSPPGRSLQEVRATELRRVRPARYTGRKAPAQDELRCTEALWGAPPSDSNAPPEMGLL